MRGADFEEYVRDVSPGLLRFGHALTLDRAEAEDLAQDTLIRVGLAWRRVRRDGNPVGYAQRTMVNLFLNRRRGRRDVPVAAVPERGGEDRRLAAVDSSAELREMLAGLPPKQRAAVVLRYLHDMPDDEIAEWLECSPQTVRSQVSRGLARLRAAAVALVVLVVAGLAVAFLRPADQPTPTPVAPAPSAEPLLDGFRITRLPAGAVRSGPDGYDAEMTQRRFDRGVGVGLWVTVFRPARTPASPGEKVKEFDTPAGTATLYRFVGSETTVHSAVIDAGQATITVEANGTFTAAEIEDLALGITPG